MSDLIDKQTVIDALYDWREHSMTDAEAWHLKQVIFDIKCMPSLDLPSAEPERKKGKWIKVGHWGRSYKCNQCGNYLDFDGVNAGRGDANFCPNCGADMRGEHE